MVVTMIDKTFNYAIVGASNNKEKSGYKVTKFLNEQGYSIIPVNPHESVILDIVVSKTLTDVRSEIDVVIFVVPPTITEQVLETVNDEGINKVWFQPGSESDLAIEFCKQNGIDYVAGACITTPLTQ